MTEYRAGGLIICQSFELLIPSFKTSKLHRAFHRCAGELYITKVLENINREYNSCNVSHHMQLSETTIEVEVPQLTSDNDLTFSFITF